MAKERPLIPIPVSQLQNLSDEKTKAILELVDKERERQSRYAARGQICGTVCLLACLAAATYLIVENHDTAAGIILGSAVLSVIIKIITARL